MELPFFFVDHIAPVKETLVLGEETSRHVSQVLRMRVGEALQLTDGKGNVATAEVTDAHKKKTAVMIRHASFVPRPGRTTCIAISLLKNANRFEWFLEKATELGIHFIIPLLCEHTERQHFRMDRMQAVLVSAMLQSQQAWCPRLNEPVAFGKFVDEFNAGKLAADAGSFRRFIAHCADDAGKQNLRDKTDHGMNNIVLIGPEGDFSREEIQLALRHHFMPVSLGNTRLRAETAGVVAAAILCV